MKVISTIPVYAYHVDIIHSLFKILDASLEDPRELTLFTPYIEINSTATKYVNPPVRPLVTKIFCQYSLHIVYSLYAVSLQI